MEARSDEHFGASNLPPLAIARLGSSPEPLENYDLVVEDPLGYRTIRLCETFGSIPRPGNHQAYTPGSIRFATVTRSGPVAPFLEVFARTGADSLSPLRSTFSRPKPFAPGPALDRELGNIKAFRRTGDENDKILADASFGDHAAHPLEGQCARISDRQDPAAGVGAFIKPSAQPSRDKAALHAGRRVWSMARGRAHQFGWADGPLKADPVLDGRIIYDHPSRLERLFRPGRPSDTNPGAIYASFIDQ